VFKRLKKLLKREGYIDTLSPAFFNKAKSNSENSFICVVTDIDTTYDTITLYSFHHDSEFSIPASYESSIKINDIVLVVKVEGIYHILGKANIDFKRDTRFVYDPDSLSMKDILKEENVNVETLDKVEYLQEFHIKKDKGDIVKHIKLTGYRIKEEAFHIFSGITRLITTFSDLYGVAKAITFQLFNNKSFITLKENPDASNAYKVEFFYKNKIPYMIEIKGDVITALADYKISTTDFPFLLDENTVYCKIVFKKTQFEAKQKNIVSHQYINRKNSFSSQVQIGGGINENMIDKIKPFINEEVLIGKIPTLQINASKFECTIIETETIDGKINKYAFQKTDISTDYSIEYSNNIITAADTMSTIWETAYEEYNYPYTDGSYKITKTYSNEEINNFLALSHKKWTYFKNTELNTYYKQEVCDDCNIKTVRMEEVPYIKAKYGFVYEDYSKMDNSENIIGKMVTITQGTDKITMIQNIHSPFYLSGKIGQYDFSITITNNSIVYNGFKNILFEKVQNVVAQDSLLSVDKLQVSNNSIFKGMLYVTNNSNIVLNSKSIYITGTTALFKADNIVSYGTKSVALYSSDNINSSGIFVNPNVLSLNGEEISIPGYCRC